MCFENLNKRAKNFDVFDIGLLKLIMISFTLFVITIWPAAMNWVHSVNPWWFFVAFVIFAIRPGYRFWIK